ncbi:phage tail protein I [Vibrio crassostreae]|uniref:phage tail protein I n=1 Tax=Vibrio crassostreae TaxID=246167 RepID=UPI0010471D8F|nr:phage tail protein I [Vibrio crassostreae]TCO05781.1 phage tail P2-like protein [Vibrio crassostreae]CAK2388852.1 Phage tail protein I [Vibrio crassostreae]CAK2583645.1 Phage tail protein I [Vibrio crassostreae]CAK2595691.1 Phage tail protein I [Vibrio crassostreae]CAK2781897.1 Phage tail protein I [Vibrio crassostreae]
MSDLNEAFLSVQPNNASLIEEALEFAWTELIQSTFCPYPNLKQPLLTDKTFVVLLAGERGVTDWQPKDTLESQRKTVDKAFDIHRKAGTRLGLSIALDAIDCDVEVTPWHQMQPKHAPYHIECIAWQRNQPLDKAATTRVLSRIESTKSERDTVDFIMALGAEFGFEFSAVKQNSVIAKDDHCSGNIKASLGFASLSWGAATRLIITTDFEFGAVA